jgi:hypothetical protein
MEITRFLFNSNDNYDHKKEIILEALDNAWDQVMYAIDKHDVKYDGAKVDIEKALEIVNEIIKDAEK